MVKDINALITSQTRSYTILREIIVYSRSTINTYFFFLHKWWIPLIKFMMGLTFMWKGGLCIYDTPKVPNNFPSITMYTIKWPTPSLDSLPKFATLIESTVPTNLKGIDFALVKKLISMGSFYITAFCSTNCPFTTFQQIVHSQLYR